MTGSFHLTFAAAARRAAALMDVASHPSHFPQLHALLFSSGLHRSIFLVTKLLHSAVRLGPSLLPHARRLFDEIPHPNIYLYNAAIRLHSHHDAFADALHLYSSMLVESVLPDGFTLPGVLKASGGLLEPAFTGRAVHSHVLRLGYGAQLFIQNGLVAMYARCGDIVSGRKVFDGMTERNVVSWTSAISGSAQNGFPLEALELFRRMCVTSDIRPDFIALVSVLKAYMDVEDLGHGSCVHGLVIKEGFEDEPDLLISLTAMYAKCGQVLIARSLFDQVTSPRVILWNAIISGYAKNGYASEAVELFQRMVERTIRPDSITITSTILACAQLGSLEVGKWMENYTRHSEYKNDTLVNTALIDMFAKCGSIADAHVIFDQISDKDVVVWSAIIVGYGMHGRGMEAISLFEEMKCAGIRPNDVTFLGLLSACNHTGLVEEGWRYFHTMRDNGIEPRHQHYACVVDLLARAGHLEKAYEFILRMPMEPEISVWGALLSACKNYGHVSLGEYAAKHIFTLDPLNAGHYVQLSNIYASSGLWNDVSRVRVTMKERGIAKALACSSIEVNGRLYSFHTWDNTNLRSEEIFTMLYDMERKIKDYGFFP